MSRSILLRKLHRGDEGEAMRVWLEGLAANPVSFGRVYEMGKTRTEEFLADVCVESEARRLEVRGFATAVTVLECEA